MTELEYARVKAFTMTLDVASVSKIQRAFKISFNPAMQYLTKMLADGILEPPNARGLYVVKSDAKVVR